MANICVARIRVEPRSAGDLADVFPASADDIKRRLEHLHYEHFDVVDEDDERIEIACGFRWHPPFEDLLSISADFNAMLRCLYEEESTGFMGVYRAEDGKVLQDASIDYE